MSFVSQHWLWNDKTLWMNALSPSTPLPSLAPAVSSYSGRQEGYCPLCRIMLSPIKLKINQPRLVTGEKLSFYSHVSLSLYTALYSLCLCPYMYYILSSFVSLSLTLCYIWSSLSPACPHRYFYPVFTSCLSLFLCSCLPVSFSSSPRLPACVSWSPCLPACVSWNPCLFVPAVFSLYVISLVQCIHVSMYFRLHILIPAFLALYSIRVHT